MNSAFFRKQSNTGAEDRHAAATVVSACKELQLELKLLSAETMFYSAKYNSEFINVLHPAIQAGTDPQKLFTLITTVRNLQGETILHAMLKNYEKSDFFECVIYFFGEKITHAEWLLALTSNKDTDESTPLHAVAKNAVLMKSFLHAFEATPSRQMFSMFTTAVDKHGMTPLGYALELFDYVNTTGRMNNGKYVLNCFTDIPGNQLFATFTQPTGRTLGSNLFTTAADTNLGRNFIPMIKLLLRAPSMSSNDLCDQLTKLPVINGKGTLFDAICHDDYLTRKLLILVIEALTKSLNAEQLWRCFNTRGGDHNNTNLFSVACFDFAVFLKVMDCFTGKLTATQLIDVFMQEQHTPGGRGKISTILNQAITAYRIRELIQHLVNACITSGELVDMISRISFAEMANELAN